MTSNLEKFTAVFRLKEQARRTSNGDKAVGSGAGYVAKTLYDRITNAMTTVLPQLCAETNLMRVDGSQVKMSDLIARINEGRGWGGSLEAFNLKFSVAELPALGHLSLTVEQVNQYGNANWREWSDVFTTDECFLQAWIANVEYDYWQNASDPLEYETAGRDYSNLPMTSNGLPFPLDQNIIDVSANPARVDLKEGYIEAIGAHMWLGDQLFELTHTDSQGLVANLPGFVVKVAGGVQEVCAPVLSFVDEKSSDLQRLLRKAIYGHE